ncbi:MAG: CotS family spore coat protein [Clostridiaceae bacterium]
MPKSEVRNKSYLLNNKEIKNNLLPQFDINATEILQVKFKDTAKQRCVYKVIADMGNTYCLKKVYYSEEELLFIYCAIEWLYRKGILVPKFLPSKDGNRFINYKGMLFILTPWIMGEKCNYDIDKHIFLSIKNLSKLHKVSKDFYPLPNVKIKTFESKLYPSLYKHFISLLHLNNLAYKIDDSFSKNFCSKFSINETLAKLSTEAASEINYDSLSKSIIHNDYVNKNLIINQHDQVYAIDFDKCKFGYSIQDLSYCLRRLMKRTSIKWSFAVFEKIIDTYEEISPLSYDELLYLYSYLIFPQKFWRISKDYYNNINKCNKKIYNALILKDINKCEYQLIFAMSFKDYIEKRFNKKI